ncbi:hypothetical protein F503_08451 [Ophiostoma piceae UAMH 11346]|uniref:Uncharacterized protein n=1 Tax=Ophiostoma piceae (strain UAMH 11346) TaxID=1262450 RepID=S3CYC6_OPHP1|nr:hypothetical protein F503_08451 [Ophiostoma piceae UAMH 11346]
MFPFPKEIIECDGGTPTGIPNSCNPQISGMARLIQDTKDEEARAMTGNYQDASVFSDSEDSDDGESAVKNPIVQRAAAPARKAARAPPLQNFAFRYKDAQAPQARQPQQHQKSPEAGLERAPYLSTNDCSTNEYSLPTRQIPIPGAGAGRAPFAPRPSLAAVPPLDFFNPLDRETMAVMNRDLHANYLRNKAAREAAYKAQREQERYLYAQEALEGSIQTAIQTHHQMSMGQVQHRNLEPEENYMMRCFPEQMMNHAPRAVRAFLRTRFDSRYNELAFVFLRRCREERQAAGQPEENTAVRSEAPAPPSEAAAAPSEVAEQQEENTAGPSTSPGGAAGPRDETTAAPSESSAGQSEASDAPSESSDAPNESSGASFNSSKALRFFKAFSPPKSFRHP